MIVRPSWMRWPGVALALLLLLAVLPVDGARAAAPDPAGPGGLVSKVNPLDDIIDRLGPSTPFKVVDHNTEHRLAAMRKAARQATRIGADAITLQEVCIDQVAVFRKDHPDWTVSYHRERKRPACGHGSRHQARANPRYVGSLAAWTGGSHGRANSFRFHRQDSKEANLGLACVSYYRLTLVRICSTHLPSGNRARRHWKAKIRRKQAREIRSITDRWVGMDNLVVLGGDFNARPQAVEMDNLYSVGGHGRFSEASKPPRGRRECRCAPPTRNRLKIDYVFYSRNRYPIGTERSLKIASSPSDHNILISRTKVQLGLF